MVNEVQSVQLRDKVSEAKVPTSKASTVSTGKDPNVVNAVQLVQVMERPKEERFSATVIKFGKFPRDVSSGPQSLQVTVINAVKMVIVSS